MRSLFILIVISIILSICSFTYARLSMDVGIALTTRDGEPGDPLANALKDSAGEYVLDVNSNNIYVQP